MADFSSQGHNTTGYTPPTGGASIDNILGALKNISTAINGWTQQQQTLAGTQNLANITAPTLVKSGGGRLVGLVVIVQGSTAGSIYDVGSVVSAAAGNKIYSTEAAATVGYYPLGITTVLGIVVTPGTGQTLAVTYA